MKFYFLQRKYPSPISIKYWINMIQSEENICLLELFLKVKLIKIFLTGRNYSFIRIYFHVYQIV